MKKMKSFLLVVLMTITFGFNAEAESKSRSSNDHRRQPSRHVSGQNRSKRALVPKFELIKSICLPGRFTHVQSMALGNEEVVFLGNDLGQLICLDVVAGFEPVATNQIAGGLVTSVCVQGGLIYTTSAGENSQIRVAQATAPFDEITTINAETFVGGIDVEKNVVVSTGNVGSMAANSRMVAMATMSDFGENALLLDEFLNPTLVYPGVKGQTAVYSRRDGQLVGLIPNPLDQYGLQTQPILKIDGNRLFQISAGNRGAGIDVYALNSLQRIGRIGQGMPNDVVAWDKFFFVGTEMGLVTAYIDQNLGDSRLVASIDLKQISGWDGTADIEIRSVAVLPDKDCLWILAASSHNGDQLAPSFFVIKFN